MRMSIRSLLIVSVACFGFSAADVCSSDSYGNSNALPVRLPDLLVNYPNYVVQIPASEACPASQPIGVKIYVCAPFSPPQVNLLGLTQAEVLNAQTETVVRIIVYCSFSGSTLSNSLPEPTVTPLGQQRVNTQRYDGYGQGHLNSGFAYRGN